MTVTINGTTGIDKVQDGSIVAADLASGVALSNIGTGGITSDYIAASAQPNSFKNRIINGAMVIDQRNAGASITPTALSYTLDRWDFQPSQASKFTIQQNAGSVTPPAGFTNYLGATVASAYSIGSSDYFLLSQRIEGYNIADLAWGTANAQPVTLSFQVYSSLTGTFGGVLKNSSNNRSYPFTYTISSANTWTPISVTVEGDTTGTWSTTTSTGIRVCFGLGVGSTLSGTSGAWAAANYSSATGATSVVGTNGATFYITGVQLEKGSTATSFDYRPYGTELALCQRYCLKYGGGNAYETMAAGLATSTTTGWFSLNFPSEMRTTPSVETFSTLALCGSTGGQLSVTSLGIGYSGNKSAGLVIQVSSGLSSGNATLLVANNSTSAKLILAAEL